MFEIKQRYYLVVIGVLVFVLGVIVMALNGLVYNESNLSTKTAIVKTIEKQGKLQVIKMFFDQVHKEEVIRELFGVDFLVPDSRTLLTFTSVAAACVDLTKVTADDVGMTDKVITLRLPKPELCEDPYILADSFTVYDQNWVAMILNPDQEITAQKNAVDFARQRALDNRILDLAEGQADNVLGTLLETITDKRVDITFAAE